MNYHDAMRHFRFATAAGIVAGPLQQLLTWWLA